jgi:hypothetical protein
MAAASVKCGLAALVGKEEPGLSASTVARLKDAWREEYAH